MGMPRDVPAGAEEAVWEKGWEWGKSQHQLRAQGRTFCNAPKLGSRLSWDAGLRTDLICHSCSTDSSQRKGARSVPIPVTPGFKITCKI